MVMAGNISFPNQPVQGFSSARFSRCRKLFESAIIADLIDPFLYLSVGWQVGDILCNT
jgi:hypothetical protein